MIQKLKNLLGHTYQPLNKITVSKNNLLHNYTYLSSLNPGIKIAPVLKSNAYGHGIVQIAQILDNLKAPFFCVDSLYEGYQLLKASIKTNILIMGYINPDNLKIKKLPFSYAVYSLEMVEAIHQYQSGAGIHIFVDSGMHREGVRIEELAKFLKRLKKFRNIEIEGLMSHFAAPDDVNNRLTLEQVSNFQEAQIILKALDIQPKWVHMAASSGLLNHKYYKNIGNMARVGKALYGFDPKGDKIVVKPVFKLSTTLVQIKDLQKRESVGYDFTFKAPRNMRIGILPIGYNDGVDRRLSNEGCVFIDDTYCPIVGRVSMNITTIDISELKKPYIGQEVTIFSNKTSDKNSISSVAKICNTIPHDLLVHMPSSIRREVF